MYVKWDIFGDFSAKLEGCLHEQSWLLKQCKCDLLHSTNAVNWNDAFCDNHSDIWQPTGYYGKYTLLNHNKQRFFLWICLNEWVFLVRKPAPSKSGQDRMHFWGKYNSGLVLWWTPCPQGEPLVSNKARKSKAALFEISPKCENLYLRH